MEIVEIDDQCAAVLFDEIGLMKSGARGANVVATEESLIFRLATEDVLRLLDDNVRLGEHLRTLATLRG